MAQSITAMNLQKPLELMGGGAAQGLVGHLTAQFQAHHAGGIADLVHDATFELSFRLDVEFVPTLPTSARAATWAVRLNEQKA